MLRVRDHEGVIVREDGMGSIIRLSTDPNRLYGYSPTDVIIDELAWWTTPNLRRAFAALTSGGGARRAPQTYVITTAGEASTRHDSILGTLLDAAFDTEDLEREPGLTIARMPAAETLVWAYEAPTTDPHDLDAMKLANPASWIKKAYLTREAENPELTDAQVLQLHGCVWAATSSTWIAPDAWAACTSERVLQEGEPVVGAFDGSYRRDASAVALCTLDGFVSVVVWERPEGAGSDWKIDRQEVSDAIAELMERFDVLELACDPPGLHAEIEQWREQYGGVVVDFPTAVRARMAPACDRFRVAVLEGDLSHDGDPVLARHVGHCVAKETPFGTIIGKEHPDSPRKIDAAVAAVVAFERAAWHSARPTEPFFAFI
jgi:phage terminase large subunit-like protein